MSDEKKLDGELLCTSCPGPRIELGVIKPIKVEGIGEMGRTETVSIPTTLRRIVGRCGTDGYKLECGHCIHPLVFYSAQEFIRDPENGIDIKGGHMFLAEMGC
jgi:hypothetical protein